MTKKNEEVFAVWGRFVLEIVIIMASIFLAYGGIDKRLAVIETQVKAASEAQKDWATKAAVEDLGRRIERLEQGGSRGR
jgi:cell division protein FtsB